MSLTDISLSETRSTKHHIMAPAALEAHSHPVCVSMLEIIRATEVGLKVGGRSAQSGQTQR